MNRFVLVLVVVLALTALAAEQLSMQVRQASLRSRPSYLSAATVEVAYGARLTVLETRGAWRKLRTADGAEGWLHESALTEKRVQLSAGQGDVQTGADTDELALAGKGFNEEVEKAFQADNRQIDYTWVDRMASWTVTPEEAVAFLAAGEVKGGQR
ncbi:MAG: SH3 domain-containing protein [Candidatus Krumholzibacteriia bacterium]